jgi:hypothetical protein
MTCLAVWIGWTAIHNAFPPIRSYNTNGFLICSQYGYGDKSAQSVAFAIAEAGAMCKVRKALLLQNASVALNSKMLCPLSPPLFTQIARFIVHVSLVCMYSGIWSRRAGKR